MPCIVRTCERPGSVRSVAEDPDPSSHIGSQAAPKVIGALEKY